MNKQQIVKDKQREDDRSRITFPDPLPKENIGSLLKLFTSPYFTLDMAVLYIFEKDKVQGIHDYLVNKLYSFTDKEIDFYVAQLSYLLIRSHSPSLEKFLVDKGSNNITLFLKIYWCVLAYGEAERKKKDRYEYVEGLLKKIEHSMVTGSINRPSLSPEKSYKSLDTTPVDRTEMMKADYHKKKSKSDYLAATFKLIKILTAVSIKLKTLKTEERKPQLKVYVKRINKWMQGIRRKHAAEKDEYFRKLFYGLHLPFYTEPDDNSTMIVNILEDQVTCFNTKKRAPYRIVVETVDMDELVAPSLSSMRRSNRSHASITSMASKAGDQSVDIESSMEEDAFQDLLEGVEEERKEDVTNLEDAIAREKFRGLADFENLVKEEEFKAREGNIIEDEEEVIKKLEYFQKGSHSEDRAPSPIKLAEASFDFINGRKSSLMITQGPLSQMRKSFTSKEAPEIRLHRSNSQENLSPGGYAKYMETFQDQFASDSMRSKMEGEIDELKKEANERTAFELKVGHEETEKKEQEVIGWGPWDELWEHKKINIRKKSEFGHYNSYKLRCIIVKANDDLRQELIAMQVMQKFEKIWKDAGLSLRVRTYDILVTSEDSGIIEFVPDSISIDGLKKTYPGMSMLQFFKETYGYDFEEAQKNFIDSLAAYSLICYFLQIKDRHNGNILLDAYGHIVHIDFGFILCTSPGNLNFESAPFKLTREYGEMMGGPNSNTFTYFKLQLTKGFMELRKYVSSITQFLQIMKEGSDLTCFEKFDIELFRERFQENSTDAEAVEHVSRLVSQSYDNWRTIQYDSFQKYTNGVLP